MNGNGKRNLVVLLVVMAMLFLAPNQVQADDYVAEAVKALQDQNVYVAPDTEGTDENTAVKLQKVLRPDDRIVLVMLPSGAADGTDIETLVKRLSEGLDNERIIGLAVGKDVIGYAPILPTGVAADQMNRADSVSNDPMTALITYARNLHLWQDKNPQPTATLVPTQTPVPTPRSEDDDSSSLGGWLLLIVAIVVGLFFGGPRILRMLSSEGKLEAQKAEDLALANSALNKIFEYKKEVSALRIRNLLDAIYRIASNEIVREIQHEPERATATTVLQIRNDITSFAEVLNLYTQILSGHLRTSDAVANLRDELESEFFPNVLAAFKKIADKLDHDDVKALELLVRSLRNDFKTRGLD